MAWTKEARIKAANSKKESGSTNQFTKAKLKGESCESKCKGRPSAFLGKAHSDESKNILRQKALASNHRRLVRSIRPYIQKNGETILLDSSWEEKLAVKLDKDNIEWLRPDPIKWVDKNGCIRNYFPDFYLPEYDLFLDPKNPAAYKQQIEKVEWLLNNVKNLKFLLSEKEIELFSPDS